MANLTYLDFCLRIEQHGLVYRARVTQSPIGEHTVTDFELPTGIASNVSFASDSSQTRHSLAPTASRQKDSPKEFGRLLFEAVFRDAMLVCLRSSLTMAETTNEGRLRIRLDLTDTPDLIDLPWEYLFDPAENRFLCLSIDTPLVRYLDVPGQIQPLAIRPPLRALVVMPSPDDLPLLDVDAEWKQMQSALKDLKTPNLLVIERLEIPTLAALQDKLRRNTYQILHFIGHSRFDNEVGRGNLIFENENKHARLVTGELFSTILHDVKTLRLVILNTCSGARTSAANPFAGISQRLIQQGIPSVIAMQFDVTDQAAITLAHTFYKALVSGYPVDAALAEARKAIAIQNDYLEWGTPVLYMRATDGQLFAIAHKATTRTKQILVAAAIVLVFVATLLGVFMSHSFCAEQVAEVFTRKRPPDVYGYIERSQKYRKAYRFACAQRDLNSGMKIATTNEEKAKLYYGFAAMEVVDGYYKEAHQTSLAGLRYDNLPDGITALLNLTDGLALCLLEQSKEANERLTTFLTMAQSQPVAAPYRIGHISLRSVQQIYEDLLSGSLPKTHCWEQARDLP